MGCIYKITNKINGKSYVGLTTKTIEERWDKHVRDALISLRPHAIQLAIRKYGVENFSITTIFESSDLRVLNEKEKEFIAILNTLSPNGYNLHTGGEAHSISESTRITMSKVQLGKKQSEITKKKRSDALSGRKQSPEFIRFKAECICKPVIELTTGLRFKSVKEAAEYFQIRAKGISKNLHGKSRHYFGKKFNFLPKEQLCK